MQGHVHNIEFDDFVRLIEAFGFEFARQRGTSHRIYTRDDIEQPLSIQPQRDGSAKPYQVRQLEGLVKDYDLSLEGEADG